MGEEEREEPLPLALPARPSRPPAPRSVLGCSAGRCPLPAARCPVRLHGGPGPGPGPGAASAPPPPREEREEREEEEEGAGELCLVLARTKTRSYGSTAAARPPPPPQRYLRHRVVAGDTRQGIALKFGVTMEQIKRANKLFTNDCIFLKETLNIPVPSEKPSPFNGLDSPCPSAEDAAGVAAAPLPALGPRKIRTGQAEELSARDFLQKLDLQIDCPRGPPGKLKGESRDADAADGPYAGSSYHM
ncbi:LOW QUALITY PROTEIN: lysM and putative peptidoglycan-binding domain-containing protein 2 [Ornithorhynchus anatinus]|uniref:LOW QUALITY PROTEIN: lysM and putative peptidoglycan-binding domain-containing protein 2 n=1 Tax=Ornithorhynchus anatinus TaxID=9258 RepID=UPI0019D443D1|nr:LOW QUALITY PROTEIN: lysM and putative peptidoglycan-binding domain-containing protein 2 [Ornithorhynchus anatinus]